MGGSAASHSLSRLRVASAAFFAAACGARGLKTEIPPADSRPIGDYRVLITARDSLSDALARVLEKRGYSIRRTVEGGSPPTALLVMFLYRPAGDSSFWLAARIADTRSGTLVAAVSAPLRVLGAGADSQAVHLADSIATRIAP